MSNSHSLSHSELSVNPTHTLVDERPSPFTRAEQVKREFSIRLDALLSEYKTALAEALNVDSLSPAYQVGEIAGYVSRLGRILRAHEQLAIDRAAAAERRERGTWVKQTQGGA
jgi:hypothetical protein